MTPSPSFVPCWCTFHQSICRSAGLLAAITSLSFYWVYPFFCCTWYLNISASSSASCSLFCSLFIRILYINNFKLVMTINISSIYSPCEIRILDPTQLVGLPILCMELEEVKGKLETTEKEITERKRKKERKKETRAFTHSVR